VLEPGWSSPVLRVQPHPGNGELTGYGTTEFQNNLLGVGREIPNSGSTTAYTRQPDGTLVAQRTSTTKQSIFTNRLGSTIAVTDHANNNLDRTYTYHPYGTPSTTGTGATSDMLYAGGLTIGSLDHFGARYHDPTTATWTQQDPINQISSLAQANHYTYAGGHTINAVDPTGEGFSPTLPTLSQTSRESSGAAPAGS
jgi:RHS repeat-associated protein